MMNLLSKQCEPCEGGVAPLDTERVEGYLKLVNPHTSRGVGVKGWEAIEKNTKIRKEFVFKDFAEAMRFVNKVAEVAEAENHHPDIHVHYRRVILELWTHAIGGLSENDFIVAAKADAINQK